MQSHNAPDSSIAVEVVADHRERRSGVIDALESMDAVSVTIRHLALGDYRSGSLLVERKTVTDFAISVMDGRLFSQAFRMASSEHRTCFVVEGPMENLGRVNMSEHAFRGALITVNLVFDQPVLLSGSPAETAWLIITAARQLTRREARVRPRRPAQGRDRASVQSHVLQGVPGVGPVMAQALLAELGTVQTVVAATADELLRVKGIGPTMARRIRWSFGDPVEE